MRYLIRHNEDGLCEKWDTDLDKINAEWKEKR